MRRRLSIALILFGLVPALLSGPAAAAQGRGAHVDGAGRGRNPSATLRQGFARGGMTLGGWLTGLRDALVTRTAGTPLTFLGGELPDDCDDYTCPSIRPFAAGDLDGDGSEDVFTSERIDGAWFLKARRGQDGSVLWSSPIKIEWYGYAFFGRADVIGDDTREIVLLEAHAPYTGVYEPLAGAVVADLQQSVRVLRVGDGAVVWERSYEGSIAGGGAWGAGNLVSEVRDLIIDLSVMEDATGDGVADVLVERASRTNVYAGLGVGSSVVRTSAETLDGRSGRSVATLYLQTTGGYPVVVPTGDLSGDGLSDLVTVVGAEMAAYPVAGGAPLWRASLSGLGRYPYPTPTHLTDGPRWDVMIETDRPDLGFLSVMTAFRGANGARLWSYTGRTRDTVLALGGDVDGDGATDLVAVGLEEDYYLDARGHRVGVISGASGTQILDEIVTVPVEAGHRVSYHNCYWCLADVTGDGVVDAVLRSSEYVDAGEGRRIVAAHTSVRSLRDGSVTWERRDADAFLVPVPVDLNGDGTSDLADYACCVGGGLRFLDGSSGEDVGTVGFLASVEDPFGAAIDGAAGDEVVGWLWFFHPETETWSFGVQVSGVAGSLWSVVP